MTSPNINPLEQDEINGEISLPGVPWADVVGKAGKPVAIYGWTGDGTGKTRAALRLLKAFGNGEVVVIDPGEEGSSTREYWRKMMAEGLVSAVQDEGGQVERACSGAAFRSWFAKSRVIDDQGKPRVVFHGSGSGSIHRFQSRYDGAGWFAESPGLASSFATESGGTPTVYPVYLSIQNPLDVRTPAGRQIMIQANAMRLGHSTADQLSPLGYDGLVGEELPGSVTWLAFRPDQIKSAIGHSGTRPSENDDEGDLEGMGQKERCR